MRNKLKITQANSNVAKIQYGSIELDIYCFQEGYVKIESKASIQYPASIGFDLEDKNAVTFRSKPIKKI